MGASKLEERLNRNILSLEESLIRKFNIHAQLKGAKYFLTLGEPDFPTPKIIKEACIKALEADKTKYSLTVGNQGFRRKIREFELNKNEVDYEEDEILITTGSTEALTCSLLTMLNPGDEVILLTPTYPLYQQIINFAGGQVINYDTSSDQFQINEKRLASLITNRTKAMIITSPNNPTGTILSDESLDIIHRAVIQHGFFVISDECYNQIVYGPRRLGISKFQDIKDSIIVCQSLSKPYAMPGWRLGYMLAPKGFLKHAMKMHQYMVVCVNTFIQDAGMVAMDFDPSEMVESYEMRRDYVYSRLCEIGIEVVKPEGAFYMFPSIKKYGLDSWEFCSRLVEEEGIALIPGKCFGADDFVRISYCVEMSVIIQAIDGLERFIKNLELKI